MPALSGFLYKLKTPTNQAIAEGDTLPALSAFADIEGFQTNEFNGTAQEIDITSKSSGENRELLDGRGVVSIELSGDGILQPSPLSSDLAQAFLRQKLRWFSVEREDGRKFIAKYKLTAFNTSGSHDGPINFSLTLMSSGTIYIRDTDGFAFDTGSDRVTAFASQVSPFSYFLYNSPRYFPSQLPAKGSARTTALKAVVTALATPVNSAKLSGTPTTAIALNGPTVNAPTPHTITFAINTSDYKGFSRASAGLVSGSTGTLAPDLANLLEIVANASNIYATVASANKFWLIEGSTFTVNSVNYKWGGYDDATNRAKLLTEADADVRGDSINVVGSNDTWDQAIARDTLPFNWQVKNQYTIPVILLEKSVLAGKHLQVLDAVDNDITSSLMFAGEKTDSTNVVWNSYYIDSPLHDAETSDIKVQIGD